MAELSQYNDRGADLPQTEPSDPPMRWKMPPAKGACWYCDKRLDNVRRFCSKSCSNAFREEEESTQPGGTTS